MNWLNQSRKLLHQVCTPYGIKASLLDRENYGAVFARDAVMAGIAGILLKDNVIIDGLKNSLFHLKKLQGKQGQIASNFTVIDDKITKVSFGTLSPKIDSATWYLIGVALLIKEGSINKADYQESVVKTIELLDALEYNGKHLIYIPKGGNWADEYVYEGYIMYDQLLRAWGLSLLAEVYHNWDWHHKYLAILQAVKSNYINENKAYLNSSIYPGGVFDRFDFAAHTLAGIVFGLGYDFVDKSLNWIQNEFLIKEKLPPAFYPTITATDREWNCLRQYHLYDFKNKPHHYHNGGIWWIWLGWFSVSLSLWEKNEALHQVLELSFGYLDRADQFDFDEYMASDDLLPGGTKKLCYTATGVVLMTLARQGFDFSVLKSSMTALIQEPLELKSEYFQVSTALINMMQKRNLLQKGKLVVGICGESGSGKSVTAKCLQIELKKLNIDSIALHQDSYFRLPPKENHQKRKSDITWVGTNEVRMKLWQSHIDDFKDNKDQILAPSVDYQRNCFTESFQTLNNTTVLILEGVYAFLLKHIDFKIFMERTYLDTLEQRRIRSREVYDPYVEQVLSIEHELVHPLHSLSDVTVTRQYQVREDSHNKL